MSRDAGRAVDVGPGGPAGRAAAILLPVSGGITVLGALLLFGVAILGVGGSLLALLSLASGLLQIVLGTQAHAGEPGTRRATVWCCLGSSFVAVLLLGVGSGATLAAVVLPLVVVGLLLAGDHPGITRAAQRWWRRRRWARWGRRFPQQRPREQAGRPRTRP